MYELLLQLPYFQGMSKNELTLILDKVKMEFNRFNDGGLIIERGDVCNKFIVLMQGTVESVTYSPDNTYRLTEELQAPYAIEPYSLFGVIQRFGRTYRAKGECNILSVDKSFFYNQFSKHEIFSINLLNLISQKVYNLHTVLWQSVPDSLEERIVRFIAMRCETTYGCKTLYIKMEDLASQLHETRINISRSLNSMREKGLIRLSRKEICIPKIELLLSPALLKDE